MIPFRKFVFLILMSISLMMLTSCNTGGIQQSNSSNTDQIKTNKIVNVNTVKEMPGETLLSISETADSNYQIIDVRTPEEFQEGHVKNAINIPHDKLFTNVSYLDPYIDKELIFYCQSGRRVGLVTDMLSIQNYKGVHHLTGDMIEWHKKNYLLVK